MGSLQVYKCGSVVEMHKLLEARGADFHDFWIGTFAGVDHFETRCRCQNHVTIEDLRAYEVFSHCYTLECDDIKHTSNELVDRFGLGLRRKRVGSAATKGTVYLLLNDGETTLHKRRALVLHDDPSYRLSREAKLRITTLNFVLHTKMEFLQIMSKTKAFWMSCFGLNPEEASKSVLGLNIEGKSPDKLFSHCYMFFSENCKADCNELHNSFGSGLRQNRVRAKDGSGTIFCLVATKNPNDQATATEEADRKRVAAASACIPNTKIAPVNIYKEKLPLPTASALDIPASKVNDLPELQPTKLAAEKRPRVEEVKESVPVKANSKNIDETKRVKVDEPTKTHTTSQNANSDTPASVTALDSRRSDQMEMLFQMVRQLYPGLIKEHVEVKNMTAQRLLEKIAVELRLSSAQPLTPFRSEVFTYWEHLCTLFD